MSEPKVWTVADTRRMLNGMAAQDETSQGETTPPAQPLPPGAVSATIETVVEQPFKTVETVQTFEQTENVRPAGRDRARR